ncbi:Nmd2p NDAI_0C01910 [Naumovozyma dairenensis CBS 421]|uniref:MIF4G domain-containing protein n=1 Tax=Naumovozyma dairenensis (strain ATCC 10597 / BCRC 20456 / CBS 421 / NBRC 0211 / NRRL Y-12639) TaxID=1071378 RepID=G0W7U0_NAUDC|nr:hypothetical protein NDAI_0C01910 [Naumovozyma dairenensis CBS 421]CCD23851.1 hypothetical protein NDAI_0C01910 [Naumovozyma dairenensis CBS 421]
MDNLRRKELHELNTRAWAGEEVYQLKSQKLDSSIKRNTGFIKKLKKGFVKESTPSLLKELSELSLEKYLSEVIATVNEVLYSISNKNDDIISAVEIISALHQRFNQRFTCELFQLFLNNFENPTIEKSTEKEELLRITRLKAKTNILTELYLVGVFTSLENTNSKDALPAYLQRKVRRKEPIIFSVLKENLNYRFKLGYTTILATSFIKRYPMLIENEDTPLDDIIYDTTLKASLQTLFKVFSEAVFTRTKDLNKQINKLTKAHQKCQIRTGKSTDEYSEERDGLVPIFDRFKIASDTFAEFFKIEPLNLENVNDVNESLDEANTAPIVANAGSSIAEKLWENEEVRKFYEVLPSIDEIVEQSKKENKIGTADQINSFFHSLDKIDTKEEIDQISIDYWTSGIDNKATRNRLLKFFIETQDWSKIKVYARFLATTNKYLPEVTEEFIKYLDNGFRSQLHSNRINVKNIIFYSEMMKFMLIPSFMIFHKIRSLILNMLIPNNIEILTVFLEHSGKFLINKPELKPQMEKMVQLIQEKKRDRQLNLNTKSALENIMALLYPPSMKSLNVDKKEYTPEQQFFRILIRSELSNIDPRYAIKILRKAHWENPETTRTLFSLFTKPGKINYQNLPTMAKLLNGLFTYHREFIIKCIDQILENIEGGLETNLYAENRHRVANVKYLTEIFNMEMIKSDVLLAKLYQILQFGHQNGQPNPFSLNELDPPDNYFRIQLTTTALLSLKRFPSTLLKKLKIFLPFFDYYIFTKNQPLPKEVEFRIIESLDNLDTLGKIKFNRSGSLYESAQKLGTLVRKVTPGTKNNKKETSVRGDSMVQVFKNARLQNMSEDKDTGESAGDSEEEEEENDEGIEFPDDSDDEATLNINDDEDTERVRDLHGGSEGEESGENDSSSESNDTDDDNDDSDDGSNEDESDKEEDFRDIDADRNAELKRMYGEYKKKLKAEEERKVEDELEKQFKQILQESMETRKTEKSSGGKIPMIGNIPNKQDIIPIATKDNDIARQPAYVSEKPNKVKFTFLARSGKKTQSRQLELPTNIKFVSDVLEEEERLKSEREKIRKIVLQRSFD